MINIITSLRGRTIGARLLDQGGTKQSHYARKTLSGLPHLAKVMARLAMTTESGFSMLELMLAAAIFVVFSSGAIVAVISALNANRLGAEETIANQYNAEGMEAVRSIKNQAGGFVTLASKAGLGNQGVVVTGGVWTFSGASNTLASDTRFVRTIAVTSVQRDVSGNIVASAGTIDANTYKVVATTTWNFNSARQNSVVITEYFTNWRAKNGGMLVYGDGGTTTDAVKYQIFDSSTSTWSTAVTAFDVDGATTNKALRCIKVYSSKTRNEKIAISRHYDGTSQFIYATVWNGTSWGTPTQLSTWAATTFLDVQNFDGTYLNDGTFMAVYSDNTVIPKYRIWNGTSWAAQASLTTLGTSQIPTGIITRARPGTNEVMAGFYTQGGTTTTANTTTQYWSGAAWSAITVHSTVSSGNDKKIFDFQWNIGTPTTGILIETGVSAITKVTTRVFVANGTGGGAWGTAVTSTTTQSFNVGAMDIESRPTGSEFQGCDKDNATPNNIYCYKITFSGNVPTISTSTTVTATTAPGIQKTYGAAFESVGADTFLTVFSNNNTVPNFRKYTASTSTWDASATTITTTGSPGLFETARLIPQDQGDDMLALFADANLDVYSIFWNGTGNAMYTTPAAKAFLVHGTNGSATIEYWYDFVWDRF